MPFLSKGLTQLSNGPLGDVSSEGEGAGEEQCLRSSVVKFEALMLAHLSGGFPHYLHNAAVHHLCEEGGGSRHCNATQKGI